MEVIHSVGRRGEGSCVGGGDVFSQAAAESCVSGPTQHRQWTRVPLARFTSTVSYTTGEHINVMHLLYLVSISFVDISKGLLCVRPIQTSNIRMLSNQTVKC